VECAVLLFNAAGNLSRANARLQQWLGIDPAEWATLRHMEELAARLARHVREPQAFVMRWRSIHLGEEAAWDEVEVWEPEPRVLERLSRPWFAPDGRRAGRLELYRDITAERNMQSKLGQTEKMAALGQLVSGITHELNNPLTSIMGYAQLLLAHSAAPGDRRAGEARQIFEEAQRASRIVRNLLLFAREGEAERAPVDLNEVAERTLALRSYDLRAKNIAVQADLGRSLPRVTGDLHELQQVMLNLLVNAEQAIEARRTAKGRTYRAGERGAIGVRTRAAAGRVTLEVADDGAGIAPEILSRIFDPFFTTKPVGAGTGLGLPIGYGIVEKHGGEIRAESGPQCAPWRTRFTVELPAAPTEPQTDEGLHAANEEGASAAPAGRRVLVVEDEPTVAQLVSDLLREDGIAVESAIGGQAGLDRVLAGGAQRFDLIVCDLKMPGVDGAAIHEELMRREHPAKDRLLFITGDTLSRRSLEFLKKHGAPYVAKPFLAEELRLAVRRRLESLHGIPQTPEPKRPKARKP
jgi:two-component system NtrC family sensor kinase